MKFPSLIKKVSDGFERYLITVNNKAKAVIINSDELESLEETLEVMAIPGAYESIREGVKEAKKRQGIPLNEFLKSHRK